MKTRCYKRSYCIELTIEQYLKVEELDDLYPYGKHLIDLLTKADAQEIEYNGHFGPNIFYSLESDVDSKDKRDIIEKIVKDYINS